MTLPEEFPFEGAGDALFCGDTLFAGYRIRSHARGHQALGELLGVRVLPLELVNTYFYHIDTCFCPLDPESAIYFPAGVRSIRPRVCWRNIPRLIEVHPEEARSFACNAVVVGKTVVTNTGCPRLHEDLRRQGFSPIETPLAEFVKAGGSAKCLTLRLDGEEAAAGRTRRGRDMPSSFDKPPEVLYDWLHTADNTPNQDGTLSCLTLKTVSSLSLWSCSWP